MTYEEAKNLKRFSHPCNCGGFAASMNGRPAEQPHMHWCAQRKEWTEWRDALNKGPK